MLSSQLTTGRAGFVFVLVWVVCFCVFVCFGCFWVFGVCFFVLHGDSSMDYVSIHFSSLLYHIVMIDKRPSEPCGVGRKKSTLTTHYLSTTHCDDTCLEDPLRLHDASPPDGRSEPGRAAWQSKKATCQHVRHFVCFAAFIDFLHFSLFMLLFLAFSHFSCALVCMIFILQSFTLHFLHLSSCRTLIFFDRRPVPFGGSRCIETYSSTTSREEPFWGLQGNLKGASPLWSPQGLEGASSSLIQCYHLFWCVSDDHGLTCWSPAVGLCLVCLCLFVLFLLLVWLFCIGCVALHGDSSMDYVSILVQFCFWCTLS